MSRTKRQNINKLPAKEAKQWGFADETFHRVIFKFLEKGGEQSDT